MAVVYDKSSGRLVRETEEERRLRESQKRQGVVSPTTTAPVSGQTAQDRPEQQNTGETAAQRAARARSAESARLTGMGAEYGKRTRRYVPERSMPSSFGTGAAGRTSGVTAPSVNASEQARARNIFDAIAGLEETARGGATSSIEAIRNLYAPQIGEAETARVSELAQLERMLGQSRGTIDAATAAYLENLAPTQAFQNVPLIALQAEQNPLLAALASQGAGTQEVESQRALDTALAEQMRALSERSAAQYGATESAYVDALRRMAQGAQAAGQQALSQRGVELGAGITSRYQDLANQLRTAQLEAETEVNRNLQDMLNQIGEQRAKAVGEFGVPKESKPKAETAPKPKPKPDAQKKKEEVAPPKRRVGGGSSRTAM
jgi:hypothetical protein